MQLQGSITQVTRTTNYSVIKNILDYAELCKFTLHFMLKSQHETVKLQDTMPKMLAMMMN